MYVHFAVPTANKILINNKCKKRETNYSQNLTLYKSNGVQIYVCSTVGIKNVTYFILFNIVSNSFSVFDMFPDGTVNLIDGHLGFINCYKNYIIQLCTSKIK